MTTSVTGIVSRCTKPCLGMIVEAVATTVVVIEEVASGVR